jgi:hypothetical protein
VNLKVSKLCQYFAFLLGKINFSDEGSFLTTVSGFVHELD